MAAVNDSDKSPLDEEKLLKVCRRGQQWRARARARTPSNSPIHVAQELRERAIRIVKSGGASNVIMAEKALPKCHPNLLLLLSMDALDAVPQAEWGDKKVGLQGRKANALAWTVGSALAPAPLPGLAQLQAKRLMQHVVELRRDIAKSSTDLERQKVRERPYNLFPTRFAVPEPAPVEDGGGVGCDSDDDGGGDGRRFSDDDDDDEPRPFLPASLGVSQATQLACDISECDARDLGPAGVRYVNEYFALPTRERVAEPDRDYRRHSFHSRCTLWLGQAVADAQAAPELRATVEARTSEVEGLRLDLRDALVRIATLEDVLGKLQGRLVPETGQSQKRARR